MNTALALEEIDLSTALGIETASHKACMHLTAKFSH